MATTFDSIPFSVLDVPDLPAVEPSADGGNVYAATIRIDGNSNWELFYAKWVRGVTVRPALGSSLGGAIIIPGEGGFGDLVIPANNGDEQTWRAVLSELRPIAALTANIWRAQVVFIVGDRVS